jgi:ATP phosphoribosyltransferase
MREFVYISWLNYLGGFEYWLFTGYKDDIIDIVSTGETTKNILPGWPKSYGANADTITKQTFRKTRKQKLIRSQILTRDQAREMGEQIKSSPLVQIITSRRDRRTVIVDNQSITATKGSAKIHTLNLTITYTDDYPGQHV